MNQSEFHKLYEDESDRIYSELNKLNEDELLNIVSGKKEDKFNFRSGNDNYQIWRVFKKKGLKNP